MTADKASRSTFGAVTETLPDALFRVKLQSGEEVLAYLSGKMRLNRIKVIIGDSVEVLLDPYGGRARIIRRMDSGMSSAGATRKKGIPF